LAPPAQFNPTQLGPREDLVDLLVHLLAIYFAGGGATASDSDDLCPAGCNPECLGSSCG